MERQIINSKKHRRDSDPEPERVPGSPVMSQLVAYEWTSPVRTNSSKVFKMDFTPKLLQLEEKKFNITSISNSPDVLPQKISKKTPQTPNASCTMSENRGFLKFIRDVKEKEVVSNGDKESVTSDEIFSMEHMKVVEENSSNKRFPVMGQLSGEEEEDLFPDKSFEVIMSQIPVVSKVPVIPAQNGNLPVVKKPSSISIRIPESVSSGETWNIGKINVVVTEDDLIGRKNGFPTKLLMSDEEDLLPKYPEKLEVKKTGKETPSSDTGIPDFDDSSDQLFMDLPIDEIVASSQSNPPSFEENKGKHFNISSSSNTKTFVRHHTMPERNNLVITTKLPRNVLSTKPKSFERHTSMPPTNNGAISNFNTFRTSNSVESIESTSSSASSASTIQSNSQPSASEKSSHPRTTSSESNQNSISEEQRKLIAQKKKIAENLRNALRIREEKQKSLKNKQTFR